MLLRRATSTVAAACALIIATVSLGSRPIKPIPAGPRSESSGTLMCGAMASNPLGSWKIGPDQYAGYEINFCNQVAHDLAASMGKPIAVRYHEITWSSVCWNCNQAASTCFRR